MFNLNLVYLDYLDCELPSAMLVRLVELAFVDVDSEVRRLSQDALSKDIGNGTFEDEDPLFNFVELTILQGNKIDDKVGSLDYI
jgi:hypothetical protein